MSKKWLVFVILSMVSSVVSGQEYTVDTSNTNQAKSPPARIGSSPFVGQSVEEIKKIQAANKLASEAKKQDNNSASKTNNTKSKNNPPSKAKKVSPNSTNSREPLNSNNTGTTTITTPEQGEGTTGNSSSQSAEGDFNRGY